MSKRYPSRPPRKQEPKNKQDEDLSMADLSLAASGRSPSNPPPDLRPEPSPQPISQIPYPGSPKPYYTQPTQNALLRDTAVVSAGHHLEYGRATSSPRPPSHSAFDNFLHPLDRPRGVYPNQRHGQTHQRPSQSQKDWLYWPQSPNVPPINTTSEADAGGTYDSGSLAIQRSHSAHYGDVTDSVSSPGSLAPSSRDSTVQPEDFPGLHSGHNVANTSVPTSSISIGNQHHSQSDQGYRRSSISPSSVPSPYPSSTGSAFNSSAVHPRSTPSTKKNSKRHQCTVCWKEFPRPSGLKTHMNMHSKEKPFKCPDPDCNKTFSVRSNAKRHYRIHGGDPNDLHPSQLSINSASELQFSEPQVVHPHPAAGTSNWNRPIRWTNPRTGRQAAPTSQTQLEFPASSVHDPNALSGSDFTTGLAAHDTSSSPGFQANCSTQHLGPGHPPQF